MAEFITFSLNGKGYKKRIITDKTPETIITQIENIVSGNVAPNAPAGPSEECRRAFECPVCMERYSDNIRPTTLPCGHSLCMICMTDPQPLVSCPTCQAEFNFASQRLSVSLRDASLACAPGQRGGRRRRRRSTKRRCRSSRRRRHSRRHR